MLPLIHHLAEQGCRRATVWLKQTCMQQELCDQSRRHYLQPPRADLPTLEEVMPVNNLMMRRAPAHP